MENQNIDINALVTQFIRGIVAPIIKDEVAKALESTKQEMKGLIETQIEEEVELQVDRAINNYDFDDVLNHLDIESRVEDALGDIDLLEYVDLDGKIEEAVEEALEERKQETKTAVANALRKAVEDLDPAVDPQ